MSTEALFVSAICLRSQTRYIFAPAQMRYNRPCGRLRYDTNPLHAPQGISHRRYIVRISVYRKSRKGFISLRCALKGTTLNRFYTLRTLTSPPESTPLVPSSYSTTSLHSLSIPQTVAGACVLFWITFILQFFSIERS